MLAFKVTFASIQSARMTSSSPDAMVTYTGLLGPSKIHAAEAKFTGRQYPGRAAISSSKLLMQPTDCHGNDPPLSGRIPSHCLPSPGVAKQRFEGVVIGNGRSPRGLAWASFGIYQKNF